MAELTQKQEHIHKPIREIPKFWEIYKCECGAWRAKDFGPSPMGPWITKDFYNE